jgi:DNA-binding transcriptional MerR regulator
MKQFPMFEDNEDLKRYYSMSEVAKMFDVTKSLIRFWENEFEILKPHKNSKGDRRFTLQNIEQFRTIYHLVKERGFTLEGAKKELKAHKEREKTKEEIVQRLKDIRGFLEELSRQSSDDR